MVCFVPVQPVAASLPALPAFGTRSGRPGREHVLAVEYAVGRNEGIFVTRVRPDQMGLVLLVDHRTGSSAAKGHPGIHGFDAIARIARGGAKCSRPCRAAGL